MTNGIGGVPHNLPPNLYKLLEQVKEKWEIAARHRGDPMKSFVTLEELVALDLARVVRIAPGGGVVVQNPGAPNLAVPPAPTGFVVTNGFSHVFTEWASPYQIYGNHARTRIYRAASDNLADAVEIGQSTGFAFADMSVATGTVYYYWIRWESTSGVLGPVNDTAGTPGQRSDDPAEILELLIGEITETHLYDELNDRINLIDAEGTGLLDRVAALVEVYGDTVAAAQSAADAAQAASDAVLAKTQALLAQEGAEIAKEEAEDAVVAATAQATAAASSASSASSASGAAGSAATAAQTAKTAAETASTSAGNSASAAATSASTAASYSTDAENAATASVTAKVEAEAARDDSEAAASAAASSASVATAQASDAEESASAAATASTSASTSASNASTSASSASSSATNAAGSASTAGIAAISAATSESGAGNSAVASAGSANSASTSATSAGNSATAAMAAQVAAESARDTAAGHASAAATSASTAETHADDSQSSASAASSSATTASTQASAAATYASQASTSATTAEGHATAAATDYTAINARLNDFGGSGVSVEQKLTATASDIDGLFGQYTLKIDANGHVAGFGLSIETNNAGQSTSYFMVNANRFAIVSSTLAKRVTGQSVSSGVLTITTDGAHGLAPENEVMFTGMENEEWKSETLEVIDAPTSTTFRVTVPSGYSTPLTAAIKGNFRPLSSLSRSGTLATAVFPSGHNIVVGGKIDITNADQPEWNSQFVVTAVAGSSVTFTVTTGFTTPATASVKVARVTIPFVVADNRVVMDGAYIKNATINTAQVGTISVEKITGINATFIQANINEIDAFEIDVVNLTAENINGDLQRIISLEGNNVVGGVVIGALGTSNYRQFFHQWLGAPIGSSGHQIAINFSGHMKRVDPTVIPNGPGKTIIGIMAKFTPQTLSGASVIELPDLGYRSGSITGLGGIRFMFAFNHPSSTPAPEEDRPDIRPGDILVNPLNSGKAHIQVVQYGAITGPTGSPPAYTHYLECGALVYDDTSNFPLTAAVYDRYRPPQYSTVVTYLQTTGEKYLPYSFSVASQDRYASPVLIEFYGIVYDEDGEDGDPIGSSTAYYFYYPARFHGFAYGLR